MTTTPGKLFAGLALFLLAFTTINKKQKVAADVEIKLPPGFKTETVVQSLGSNRHLAVNSNGDVYVKLSKLKDGKGIIVLRKKNGKYEVVNSFGNYTGTGIAIKNGYLYSASNTAVFRYKMNAGNEVVDADKPETIVTGLMAGNQHETKSITLDDAGNLYVSIGAPSNACQVLDRSAGSKGQDPCPLLEKAGGIWQFKANKQNQSYAEGIRYATGLRNVVGLDWNSKENYLFAMQHGRDQLAGLFPNMYKIGRASCRERV